MRTPVIPTIVFWALALVPFSRPADAQPAGRKIDPGFGASPSNFQSNQLSSVQLCVSNLNPNSTTSVRSGDKFSFTFDDVCGPAQAIQTGPLVNCAGFGPADFAVGFGNTNKVVTLTYQGAAKTFPGGCSVCVQTSFQAPSTVGACSLSSQAPSTADYNAPTPAFNILSIVNFASGIPSDLIFPSRGAACPAGFTELMFEGRVIRSLGPGSVPGETGGHEIHVHDFDFTIPDHTHDGSMGPPDRTDGANPGGHGHAEQQHRHPLTIQAGGGGLISAISRPAFHMPPYVMLRLCAKD